MATIIHVNKGVKLSNKIVSAIEMIRGGIGILKELDDTRAESIGVGQAEMVANFGVNSTDEAQALSDRWSAFLAALDDESNVEFAKLRDLIYPFVS